MQDTPKNFYKKFLGLKGEKIAEKHLKKLGYKILKTNYVTPFGEADLVCEFENVFVFVEVKTRTSTKFGTPAMAVDYKKQKKYRQIAQYYLTSNNLQDVNVSFLVVEVFNDCVNVLTDAF